MESSRKKDLESRGARVYEGVREDDEIGTVEFYAIEEVTGDINEVHLTVNGVDMLELDDEVYKAAYDLISRTL